MSKQEEIKATLRSTFILAALLALASATGFFFRFIGLQDTNIVFVYLLAVLLTAWLTQKLVFGIISSVLATFLFYFFFVLPYFAFAVNDPNYWVTFITMMVTALVTGTLTSHAKNSALKAQKREAEARAIYALTKQLADANEIQEIADIAISTIGKSLFCEAACICFLGGGASEGRFIQQSSGGEKAVLDAAAARRIEDRIKSSGGGADISGGFQDWPFYGSSGLLGVIRIPRQKAKNLTEDQLRLLRSMIESTSLAIDRLISIKQQAQAHEEAEKERYRANLLRAISHDLRTPLTGIMGASEMLTEMLGKDDAKKQLSQDIYKDAGWLHSMVVNILSLTRLRDGKVPLEKTARPSKRS
jgi:two-component system sensor histidine kinase KdpD